MIRADEKITILLRIKIIEKIILLIIKADEKIK